MLRQIVSSTAGASRHRHVLDVARCTSAPKTRSESSGIQLTSTLHDRMTFSSSASSSIQKQRGTLEFDLAEEPTSPPRWLRRQTLQKGKAKETPTESRPTRAAKDVSKFRSKHYTPQDARKKGDDEEGMRLLEPHVLSQRLKKLCDRGKLDEAVALLKNSPLDAQNTAVWNTLIWETMKVQRYKLAYSLYVDMKRRGHSPTSRTFFTMFTGLSRIEDFSNHTQQIQNARSLYEAYVRHIKSIKRVDPSDRELSVDSLAPYIKLLGNAQCYSDIFDVFYSLDSDGPYSANPLVYTAVFQALSTRSEADTPSFRQGDAKLLWAQAIKCSKRNKDFIIDPHLATVAIAALTKGQTSDHDVAFQIAHDFYGLCPPGTPRVSGSLTLSAPSLATILRLCNASHNYDLCIEFFNQVKRRPAEFGGIALLDRLHMEEVLRAQQSLAVAGSAYQSLQILEWMLRQEVTGSNGAKIRPQLSTFNIVLATCWRSADWNSATRTFDLMTGYHSHDFMDGAVAEVPRVDRRGKGKNIMPTPETVSNLVKTAAATRNRAHMRQCLRIIDYLGVDVLLSRTTDDAEASRRALKQRGFFVTKLAQGVVDIVEHLLAGRTDQQLPEQQERWKKMAARAKLELQESSEEALISTVRQPQPSSNSPLVSRRTVIKRERSSGVSST